MLVDRRKPHDLEPECAKVCISGKTWQLITRHLFLYFTLTRNFTRDPSWQLRHRHVVFLPRNYLTLYQTPPSRDKTRKPYLRVCDIRRLTAEKNQSMGLCCSPNPHSNFFSGRWRHPGPPVGRLSVPPRRVQCRVGGVLIAAYRSGLRSNHPAITAREFNDLRGKTLFTGDGLTHASTVSYF